MHNRAFRQLQLQEARFQSCFLQRATDHREEVLLAELLSREVHRYAYGADTARLPRPRLTAGVPQHPFTDGDDQSGFLGDGDEATGCNETALRIAPADQRLRAVDAAGLDIHLRLIVQLEFVP